MSEWVWFSKFKHVLQNLELSEHKHNQQIIKVVECFKLYQCGFRYMYKYNVGMDVGTVDFSPLPRKGVLLFLQRRSLKFMQGDMYHYF